MSGKFGLFQRGLGGGMAVAQRGIVERSYQLPGAHTLPQAYVDSLHRPRHREAERCSILLLHGSRVAAPVRWSTPDDGHGLYVDWLKLIHLLLPVLTSSQE